MQAFATSYVPERGAFDSAFAELLGKRDCLVLVAEADAKISGYLLGFCHQTFFASGPVVWVEEVMVEESVRRLGIGRNLITAAERWGQDRGARYVALASRRAGNFYLSLGFEDSATFFKKTLERLN